MIATLPATIAQLPFFASGRFPKSDLIGWCRGDEVVARSAREFVERIRDVGLGLTARGVSAGDRILLLSESRPDWLTADFASLAIGGVTVPVYPTLSTDQIGFILRDCGARFAFVSTTTQLAKLIAASAAGGPLETVILMDEEGPRRTDVPFEVVSFDALAAAGHQRILEGWGIGRSFHDGAKQVAPGDLATIIYTSGTTGEPKGVMLTHGNLVANIEGVTRVLSLGPDDTALSFLPLCHAFERMVAYIYLATGVSMIFAESMDTVARDLRRVRPTVMTGVPRVFEKLHARVMATGHEAKGVKRAIFDWAAGLASRHGHALVAGHGVPTLLAWQVRLAERLVFEKIRAAVGGRLRFAVSGSAPLRVDLGEFFHGLGVPILEGYGLTETAPVLCVMPLERIRFGTVGPPLPNVELQIAGDGEVLARGPNVMTGYYNRPEETRAALADGWFHTGDIGVLDEAGYLAITDRKKELIVTSGGKKIAPQPVEAALRAHPLIAEAVLIGEQRHFPSVLLVPDFAAVARHLQREPPQDSGGARALVSEPAVQALFAAAIESVNGSRAQFERIKKFTLLDRELTIADGELTPTLKVKRRVVEQRYQQEIERMYLGAP